MKTLPENVLPFRRRDVAPTPAPAALAALDWLAFRAAGHAPAGPAQAVEPGELDEILGGALAAVHVAPLEDVLVLVRAFADGTLDAVVGRIDGAGTVVETRRRPLGRGPLLARTRALRAVLEEAVAGARSETVTGAGAALPIPFPRRRRASLSA